MPENTLNSRRILDGFKNILERAADSYTEIKIETEQRNKAIEMEYLQSMGSAKAALENAKKSLNSGNQLIDQKRDNTKHSIISSIMTIEHERDSRINSLNHCASTQIEELKACIERMEKAEPILADFFNCRYDHDGKIVDDRNFKNEIKKWYDISVATDYYIWYKKNRFIYGKTSLPNVRDIQERLSTLDCTSDKELVDFICTQVHEANLANSFADRKQKKQHVENALFAFIQFECLLNNNRSGQDKLAGLIRSKAESSIKSAVEESQKKIDLLTPQIATADKEWEASSKNLQADYSNAASKHKQEIERIDEKFRRSLDESRKQLADSRDSVSRILSDDLREYFDGCLRNVTIGLQADPISFREFMQMTSPFDTRLTGARYFTPKDYMTYIVIGSVRFDYAKMNNLQLNVSLLNTVQIFLTSYFENIHSPLFSVGNGSITIPYVIDFTFFEGICMDYPSAKYDAAKTACQSIMLHMLTDTRASSVFYTMIDSRLPNGFFSKFNNFRGNDPRTGVILNAKVFNFDAEIASAVHKQMETLRAANATFEFSNIVECNRNMRARKKPINLIVMTEFEDKRLPKSVHDDFRAIFSGVKLGYSCLLMRASDSGTATLDSLGFGGEILEYISQYSYRIRNSEYTVDITPLPSDKDIEAVGYDVASCLSSSTADIIDFLEVADSNAKVENAYDGISIDNCMFDLNNTPMSYELNDAYLNGLILGDPRYGKTRFIHCIIAGIMNKYSPDSVRIHMIDFKDSALGVGVYQNIRLPHLGIVSTASTRILGLKLLQYVEKQMEERSAAFLEVQKVSNGKMFVDKYSDYMQFCDEQKRHGIEMKRFPREVVIIDEVQELLQVQDEITTKCTALIRKIFQEAGAFAIHLIISTQWINNIETALDSELLDIGTQNKVLFYSKNGYGRLSVDPGAAASVTERGQAVYILGKNEKVCDVAYIDGKNEKAFLEGVSNRYQNAPCSTRLIRSRINDGVSSEFVRFCAGERAGTDVDFEKMPVNMGETVDSSEQFSVAVSGAIKLMMISNDLKTIASVSATMLLCLLAKIYRSSGSCSTRILYIDFSDEPVIVDLIHGTMIGALGDDGAGTLRYLDSRDAADGMKEWLQEVEQVPGCRPCIFINNVGEALNHKGITNYLKQLKENGIPVDLVLFGRSSAHLSSFESESGTDSREFYKAVYTGSDEDFKFALGNSTDNMVKRGQLILCRGRGYHTHEILPFVYSNSDTGVTDPSISSWIKDLIGKLKPRKKA